MFHWITKINIRFNSVKFINIMLFLDDEEAFEQEERAIAKAIAEEKSSLSIPVIIKGNKSEDSKSRCCF